MWQEIRRISGMRREMLVMIGFVACVGLICGCAKKEPPAPAPSKTAADTAKKVEAKAAEAASQEQGKPLSNASEIIGEVDKNGDGKISRAEYDAIWKDKAVAERNFKAFDKNGDGVLTADEFTPKLGTK
jgi:hypothetical protein